MSPAVGVVILSHDHWSYTQAVLQGLLRTRHVRFETVVVDNGSAPDVVRSLQRATESELGSRLRLRCRFNADNAGVATGRNQGAALTDAPLLLFLDNDVEIVDDGWLAALVDVHRDDPSLGVVGGVLLESDGRTVQFAGGVADAGGRVHFDVRTTPDPDVGGRSRRTAFCLGACLSTSRSLFESAGGFDTAYDPMDFEDVDYCLRLADAGHPSVVALDARLVHHGHVTTGGRDFARMRHYLVNGRTFVRRWGHRLPPVGPHGPAPLDPYGPAPLEARS
jgi:GT2 family glycosyltransferase